jgi:sulfur-carrier protein
MKVQLFGSLAETIGREVELEAGPGARVADVRRQLSELYPAAAATLARTRVRACLEDRIVGEEQPVGDEAELSFFPPLSGG